MSIDPIWNTYIGKGEILSHFWGKIYEVTTATAVWTNVDEWIPARGSVVSDDRLILAHRSPFLSMFRYIYTNYFTLHLLSSSPTHARTLHLIIIIIIILTVIV